MEQIKKLKVVFLCHFSNQEVRNNLPLSKLRVKNWIKSLLGKPTTYYKDFAPWVTNLINEFERFDDVELHVISPHPGLKATVSEFNIRGIYYHFFQFGIPFLNIEWPAKITANGAPNYKRNRRLVSQFLNRIQPDIVNLIGSENPYYSITALDIIDVPVFVSVQTAYTHPSLNTHGLKPNKLRWDVEMQIHKKKKYFGCSGTGMIQYDTVKKNNPEAIIFKKFFPIQQPKNLIDVSKEFDFIFYGQVIPSKGIEDALEALAIVKKRRNDVSFHVVGHCRPEYRKLLDQKITDLGLSDNVFFKGYFPIFSDVYQYVKKARAAVLPHKCDSIAGTISGAMQLETPVVTYKTTGTPYLNKDGVTVLIAEIGDIETLAHYMLKLLNDPEFARDLTVKAKAFVTKEFDNTKSARQLLSCLRSSFDHHHNNTPIPKELLFNPGDCSAY